MATRATPLPAPRSPAIRDAMLDHTRPTCPRRRSAARHPAAFFLSLLAPAFSRLGFTPSDAATGPQTWGHGLDGSTFVHLDVEGRSRVAAEGPLWEDIEDAYRSWLRLGRPSRTRIGLTVTPAGEHLPWLDGPAASCGLCPTAERAAGCTRPGGDRWADGHDPVRSTISGATTSLRDLRAAHVSIA